MKKGFENGNVVPIVSGNKQSGWPQIPSEDRQRACHLYPILNMGATNMQSLAEWTTQDKKRRAAKIFARLADKLRAKRDGV